VEKDWEVRVEKSQDVRGDKNREVLGDLPQIESFLRVRLNEPLPGAEAQRRFAPRPAHKGWAPDLVPDTARRAAALILLYPGANGPSLPLTMRRHDLPHHPGQISFPGGAIDEGEAPVDAALREAHEEIGIDRDSVRIVGALSSFFVIVSNFVVYPFIGVTDSRPVFRPHDREVAEVLEAPVQELLDRAQCGWERRPRENIIVDLPYLKTGSHIVWGATAMMLGELGALFDERFGPPDR
jgi:8-oxo-dGTP pyrophosphatase MutT (NUDIX family)